MLRSIKPSICPSRSSSDGFALLIVMVAAAVLLIGLTAVLPSIYQEGQREREAELIFRGKQYARAIATFHQKFQRYPNSIEDLTKLTNGFRFLRKEYADPMTPGGKWRFIHVNAQGVLLDSKTQGPPPGAMGQSGANPGAAGFGTSGASGTGGFGQQGMGSGGFGQQGGSFGQQGMGSSGFGQQGSSFGQQSMGGSSFGQTDSGNSSFGAQQGAGGSSGFGSSSSGFSSGSNFGGSTPGTQQNSGFSSGTPQGGGTFIAGVASTSHKQSIGIWNQKTHYDEWEFVGIDLGALGIAASIPGLPQGFQSGQGNQSGGFGQGNQPGGFGQGNQPSGFGQGNQPSGFGQPNSPPGQNQSGNSSSGGSTPSGSDFSPQ